MRKQSAFSQICSVPWLCSVISDVQADRGWGLGVDFVGPLEVEAAKELVKLLVGGLGEVAKKVPALWRRSGERKQKLMVEELERSARELSNALQPEQARVRQEALWEAHLRVLLAEHPDAEVDLRTLITELRSAASAANVQIGVARDNGRQFQVQGGDLHYHESPQGPPRGEDPQE